MFCKHPLTVKLKTGQYGSVACGKCVNCRITRSRSWSDRIEAEIKTRGGRYCFVTLTYDSDHVQFTSSGLMTLVPLHHKYFMHNLRKLLKENNLPEVKYFMAGEYGDQFGRPHYHYLLVGISVDRQIREIIKKSWKYGLADVQPPHSASACISYVTKYLFKRYNGELAEKVYGDAVPPYQRSSLGLGKAYFYAHREEIDKGLISFHGHPVSVPRCYIKDFPTLYGNIVKETIDRNLNPSYTSAIKEYVTLKKAQLSASERETLAKFKQRGF